MPIQNFPFSKAFFAAFSIFLVLLIVFGSVLVVNTASAVTRQLGVKCIGIASAVAILIEQDAASYREFCSTLDTDTVYYKKMRDNLTRIYRENADSIVFLYTERRVSETEMMYVFDAEPEDSVMYSPPGHIDKLTDSEYKAYDAGGLFIADTFVTSDYGTLLTSYAPIHDPADGSFLGLVGVDVSIDHYNAVINNQIAITLGGFVAMAALLAAGILLSSGKIIRLITSDRLTGAYNKSHFLPYLRQVVRAARRTDRSIVVFIADLDHFEDINERYGRVFGDALIAATAAAIMAVLRKTDCLCRYGGDRFAACLPDINQQLARTVIDRIRAAVENISLNHPEIDGDVHVTISIGATAVVPGQTAQEAISKAEKALFDAKQTRNAVSFFVESDD